MAMGAKDRLIEIALKLFTERGYDAVGVQEIVEGAGVTKPTLYHHFGSKRGLLASVSASIWGDLMARLKEPLTYRGDLPLTLESVAAVILRFATERPRETQLIITTLSAPLRSEAREVMRPAAARLHDDVSEVFVHAAAQHGNMRGRHEAYARSFLGTVFTYVTLVLEGAERASDELPHRIVHQFSHGIYS